MTENYNNWNTAFKYCLAMEKVGFKELHDCKRQHIVVTKLLSCQINTCTRCTVWSLGIKQREISVGSIFCYFPMKVAKVQFPCSQGKSPAQDTNESPEHIEKGYKVLNRKNNQVPFFPFKYADNNKVTEPFLRQSLLCSFY